MNDVIKMLKEERKRLEEGKNYYVQTLLRQKPILLASGARFTVEVIEDKIKDFDLGIAYCDAEIRKRLLKTA